jgi:hypothetical protein
LPELFRRVERARERELPEELDFKRVVKEIKTLTEELTKAAAKLPAERREALLAPAREALRELTLPQGLNNHALYAHIPLLLGGEKTAAELYVFTDPREKGKRVDPRNATVFISLSTACLGQTECFVKLTDKDAQADFSLARPEDAALLRAELPALAGGLKARGYNLARGAVRAAEQPRDLIAVFNERETFAARYSFNRVV